MPRAEGHRHTEFAPVADLEFRRRGVDDGKRRWTSRFPSRRSHYSNRVAVPWNTVLGLVFALGVMMFEMLGGRQPFHGSSTVDTLKAVLSSDPPALHALNPDVPDPLAGIVQRLLEKNPDSRFQ